MASGPWSGVSVLFGAAAFIGSALWIASCAVGPISRAGGSLQAPVRFLLSDSLGLMALLQVALAICGRALDRNAEAQALYWLIVITAVGLVMVLWAAGVSVTSRAGIVRTLDRLLVIVLLIPGTLTVIMSLPILVGLVIGGIAAYLRPEGNSETIERILPYAAAGLIAVPFVVPVLRMLSLWVLRPSASAAE